MNRKTFLNFLILTTLALVLLPSSAFCELKNLDDEGLSEVYAAEGFAEFTIKDIGTESGSGKILTQTDALFNIRAETYTEVDSLKLGYHNEYDYKDPTPTAYLWDEDWVNVRIGDKSDALTGPTNDGFYNPEFDFIADGLYLRAVFTDINNPSSRQLKSFAFGAKYIKGDIQALFNSFSGTIDDSKNGTPEYNGHAMNLGPVTITADPNIPTNLTPGQGGFEISLAIDTYDKGYWVKFENAIVTPTP